MEREEILALYDEQERRQGEHPSYQREVTPEVVRLLPTGRSGTAL